MKNVMISIKGLQSLDMGEDDTLEFVTDGEYEYGDIVRFSYMESELTGMEGTRTDFTVAPDQVTLVRSGTVSAQMTFQKDSKQYFLYETLFGTFTMGLETHSIFKRFDPAGGELEIHYVIDIDRAPPNRNIIRIDIKEA